MDSATKIILILIKINSQKLIWFNYLKILSFKKNWGLIILLFFGLEKGQGFSFFRIGVIFIDDLRTFEADS